VTLIKNVGITAGKIYNAHEVAREVYRVMEERPTPVVDGT